MKKLIIPFLFLGFVMFSCSKHEMRDEKQITIASLPKSVTSYIQNNYPAESIFEALEVSDNAVRYVVILSSNEDVEYDHRGGFLGENLAFRHDEHHHHDGGVHHNGTPYDSLSSVIRTYISTNFADYRVLHAETDSICSIGMVTAVMVSRPGLTPLKLYFDATGIFLMQGNRIASSDLPQLVKSMVTSQFPGYALTEKSEKYLLADNFSVEYFLFPYQGETRKHVIVREDGTIVCMQ